jgi:hypothetical protein
MEKKELQILSKRYLGVATGILALQQAQGQVRYVDIPDTTLSTNNAIYSLNIDQDTNGVIDFRFIQYVDTTEYAISGSFIQTRGAGINRVLGLDYANYNYPFKLNLGDTIGPARSFKGAGGPWQWGQLAMQVGNTTYPNDQFSGGATDAFIGLSFKADRNDTIRTFYGWVRVDVAPDHKSITIKDFAWQEQWDEAIAAGEGSSIGLTERTVEGLELQQRGGFLWITNPKKEARLSFYDLQGRIIETQRFERGARKIALSHLKGGIYVARLYGEKEREEIKVVVGAK